MRRVKETPKNNDLLTKAAVMLLAATAFVIFAGERKKRKADK